MWQRSVAGMAKFDYRLRARNRLITIVSPLTMRALLETLHVSQRLQQATIALEE